MSHAIDNRRFFSDSKGFRRLLQRQLRVEPLEDRRLLAFVPDGFTETVVASGLTSPVTMDIDNTGRIFLAFQNGTIRVIEDDQLLPTTFAALDADGSGERGLQGIELDPNYDTNGYLYVYYTAASPSSHNRVSRLTIDPTTGNTMVPGSELALLDLPNLSTVGNPIWHMGGAIHVAADGTLLIQVGDHQDTSKPQNMEHPFGKVLRIHRDGTIPTDNPHYNAGNGITWRDYIWSAGLRNPFSGDVDPVTGQFFINDVGAGSWEEINDGTTGGLNFGWPTTEGNFNPAAYPNFSNPVHAYPHSVDCSITGGAFYHPPLLQFPVEYHGKYFFSQFCRGELRVIDPANPTDVQTFATGAEFPLNIEFGPDGSMYYVARGAGAGGNPGVGTGQVLKVVSDVQVPPQIVTQPTDTLASVGWDATFSVSASGSLPLNYQWQRRDGGVGAFLDIDRANSDALVVTNVTLEDQGNEYRVIVSNAFGTVTSAGAVLNVTTDQPPTATIVTPAAGASYIGGQAFNFLGTASDLEDGDLTGAAMTWQIDFHHNTHLHPFFPATSGIDQGTFTIPSTGETSTDVWYRIHLSVTDSAGLTTAVFHDIFPEISDFTITTNVAGGDIFLDGVPQNGPQNVSGVIAIQRSLEVPRGQFIGPTAFPFIQWLDGETSPVRTIATPPSHVTYAALYADVEAAQVYLSDLRVVNRPGVNGLGSFERDRSNGQLASLDGGPITLNGVQYHRGLGVHADSELVYALDGRFARFISDIGVDDEVNASGSVEFRVLADGVTIFNSGTLTGVWATRSLDLDVTGVDELRLIVADAGDGNTNDHADWADARLVRQAAAGDIRVNFQLADAPTVPGYLVDAGEIFGDRGNGYSYGWSSDHTDLARDRGVNSDQRLDTLVHFHQGQTWEIDLPNGLYIVTSTLGDAGFQTTHTLHVEGTGYWQDEFTGANEFRKQTQVVAVQDGRLTLDMGDAPEKATRINYLEISSATTDIPLLPFRDADLNLDGVLDQTDVDAFLAAWGSDTTGLSLIEQINLGDLDFSGRTNLTDWGILHQAWNRQVNSGSAGVAGSGDVGQEPEQNRRTGGAILAGVSLDPRGDRKDLLTTAEAASYARDAVFARRLASEAVSTDWGQIPAISRVRSDSAAPHQRSARSESRLPLAQGNWPAIGEGLDRFDHGL